MEKKNNQSFKNQKGQSLVLLLFFALMAMTLAITAILTMVVTSGSLVNLENGIEVRQFADSGAENALLKLIRDPFYAGETYTIDGATITITVVGTTTKTINVVATAGDFTREVEVLADYTNNILRVTTWNEEF